jgi:hypothetical protein
MATGTIAFSLAVLTLLVEVWEDIIRSAGLDFDDEIPSTSDIFVRKFMSSVWSTELDMISWRKEDISMGPRETVSSTLFVWREEDVAVELSKGFMVGTPSMLIRIPDTAVYEDKD